MNHRGKHNLLGIGVDAIDYEAAVELIIQAAHARRNFTVTALAVHGVMTGALDQAHAYRLNRFDLVTPDGQPVRWAINLLHGVGLRERVYGPTLTLKICERAAQEDLPLYLYGSKPEVLAALSQNLTARFPGLTIAGAQPSRFRRVTPAEKVEIVQQIRTSGAAITLVGLGCPRQEVWVYEHRELLPMPLLAVGAAFDFHAGALPQAPALLQDVGLEWLFRLVQEPGRLWKRYVLLNPHYLLLVALQWLRLKRFTPVTAEPPSEELRYG